MSYVLNTPEEQAAMLAAIGARSIEELFAPIPESLRLKRPLDIPAPQSEIELTRHLSNLAASNRHASNALCFLGGGAYDHFTPAVVDAVCSRSEYYTAYTPYQAEASQGSLQAFFEFQTLICQLTGMEVANASLYEGGTSVTEAVLMATGITNRHGKVLVAESVHPDYRQTLQTYLANLEPKVTIVPTPHGYLDPDDLKKLLDDQTACVVVQHPNFLGCLEEVQAVARLCHEVGALFIVSFDPISLGILKKPGDYGADIAVAEGQGLGNALNYGGPYLGLLACREAYVRKIPGRIVGQTVDRHGRRTFALTLQTREQHIRREKATSNICTNQGLMALRAAVHLTALGPQGLRETAELCLRKAHYTATQLERELGFTRRFDRPFFKEFTLRSETPVPELLSHCLEDGILAGLHLGRWYPQWNDCFSVAVTEKRTREEIDALTRSLRLGVQWFTPTAMA
ncbi:MAG: aminomethyl-transferring glycine dehydrogenase subunit GcvPA [Gemmataceae bacterium]